MLNYGKTGVFLNSVRYNLKCRVITGEGILKATVNVQIEGDYFCFGNTTHYVLHPRECVDVKKIVVNVLSAERYAKLLSA